MSARPANNGNRTAQRTGATVARKLRAAGWNISPAARQYTARGVFVSAMDDYVSILVDLGAASEIKARRIAETVSAMGTGVEVTAEDGWAMVHFTYSR